MKNEYQVRGDITAIFINSPKYGLLETIIDTSDLERVQEIPGKLIVNWCKTTKGFYVRGYVKEPNGKWKSVRLHRWIFDITDPKKIVDHKNRNTMDNTRGNLNIVTSSENSQNRRIPITNSSGHMGVYWHKERCKWVARINVGDRKKYLGLFDDINDAIAARKSAELQYYEYKRRLLDEQTGI